MTKWKKKRKKFEKKGKLIVQGKNTLNAKWDVSNSKYLRIGGG